MKKVSFMNNKGKKFGFVKLVVILLSVLTFFSVFTFNFGIQIKANENVSNDMVVSEPIEIEKESKRAASLPSCSSAYIANPDGTLWFADTRFIVSSDGTYVTFLYVLCDGDKVVEASTMQYCVVSRDTNTSATCTPNITYSSSIPLPYEGENFYVKVELSVFEQYITTYKEITRKLSYPATIGDTEYGTLSAAFAALNNTTSQTIKLQRSVTECISVTTAVKGVIDLNGKTWSCSGTALSVISASTITIDDTSSSVGTMTATSYVINASGSPTINIYRGIIQTTSTSSGNDAIYVHPATLTIGNETATTSNLQILGEAGSAIYMSNSSNTLIISGLITSVSGATIYATSDSTLQIGNTTTSTSDNLRILAKASSTYAVYATTTSASYYFYSGFIGANSSSYYAYCGDGACGTTGWTGKTGTLTYVNVSQNGTTYYGYVPTVVYASNGKYYSSMKAAFSNAGINSGRTFTLKASFSESVTFNSAVNFTVDLNGYTWSNAGNYGYVLYTEEADGGGTSGTISITGQSGTLKSTSGTAIILFGYVTLTVKYGNIIGYDRGIAVHDHASLIVGVSGTSAYNTLKIYSTSSIDSHGIYVDSGGSFTYNNGFIGSASGSSSDYSYAYNTDPTSDVPIANTSYSSYYGKSKGVLQMGSTYYAKMNDAASAATNKSWTTIKLLESITMQQLSLTSTNIKYLIIDLNGQTWWSSSDSSNIKITSGAHKVKITDSSDSVGNIYSTGYYETIYITTSAAAVFTIEKGNIVNQYSGSEEVIYVSSSSAATVNIGVSGTSTRSNLKLLISSTSNKSHTIDYQGTGSINFYGGFVGSANGVSYAFSSNTSTKIISGGKVYSYAYETYGGTTYKGFTYSTRYSSTMSGYYYDKLSDAIKDASASSSTTSTIKLENNVSECVTISSTKYIEFDLNGNIWDDDGSACGTALRITGEASNLSNITITDYSSSTSAGTIRTLKDSIVLDMNGTLNIYKGHIFVDQNEQPMAVIRNSKGTPTINIGDSTSTVNNLLLYTETAGYGIFSNNISKINVVAGLIMGSLGAIDAPNAYITIGTQGISSYDNLQIVSPNSYDSNIYGINASTESSKFIFNGGFIGSQLGTSNAYNTTPTTSGFIVDMDLSSYSGKTVYYISVGSTYYEDMSTAFSGASSGSVIKLLGNINQCVSNISLTKNITIDLNGKTWSCTSGSALRLSAGSSSYTLTITDTSSGVGTITSSGDTISSSFTGTLKILKGKIITTCTNENHGAIWQTAGNLIIGDSSSTYANLRIEATGAARGLDFAGSSLTINNGLMSSVSSKGVYFAGSSLTINDGTITSTKGSGLHVTSGTVTIPEGKAPTFTGTKGNGIYISGGILNISGGKSTGYKALNVAGGTVNINNARTVLTGRDDERSVSTYSVYATGSSAKVTINNGTFHTNDYYIYALNNATVIVNGGNFNEETSVGIYFVYASGATVTINDGDFDDSIYATNSAKVTIIKGTPSKIEVSSATLVYGDSSTSTVDNLKTMVDSTSIPAIKATSSTVTINNGFILNSSGHALQLASSTAYIYKGIVVSETTTTGYYAIHSTSSTISIGNASSTISDLVIESRYKIAIYQSAGTITAIRGLIMVGSAQAIELENSAKFYVGDSTSTVDNLVVIGWETASKITSGIVTITGGFYGSANANSYGTVTIASGYTKYDTTIRMTLENAEEKIFFGVTAWSSVVAHLSYSSTTYYYNKLQKAVDFLDSSTSGQYIYLDSNLTEHVTVSSKKGYISLNGKTWTASGSYAMTLLNSSDITITDTSSTVGTITGSQEVIYIGDTTASVLKIYKGIITGYYSSIYTVRGSTASITIGNTNSTTSNLKVDTSSSQYRSVFLHDGATLTVNNGYIGGISSDGTGDIKIYKGVIVHKTASITTAVYSTSSASVQIGDDSTTSADLKLLASGSNQALYVTGNLTIYGGFIANASASNVSGATLYGIPSSTTVTYDGSPFSGIKFVVAHIGTTYYETLKSAFFVVGTNAQTIVLDSNRREQVSISSSKSVYIDLNGKTWSAYSNVLSVPSSSSVVANITIQDSSNGGTIVSDTSSAITFYASGTLWIRKGIIKGMSGSGISASGPYKKTITIGSNGSSDNEKISIYGSLCGINFTGYSTAQELTIYGGYIKGNSGNGVIFNAGGSSSASISTLNIYGGTIVGNTSSYGVVYSSLYSSSYYGSKVTIGNSTTTPDNLKIINLHTSGGYGLYVTGNSTRLATLFINGGFIGSIRGATAAYTTMYTTVTINGELFDTTSSYEYKENGVTVSSNTNVPGKALAPLTYNDWDETIYCFTLQECFDMLPAYDADNDGVPVITLLSNRQESVIVSSSKIGKVDLNGHIWEPPATSGYAALRIIGTSSAYNNSIITIDDSSSSVGTISAPLTGAIDAEYIGSSGKLSILKGNLIGKYLAVEFTNSLGTLEIGNDSSTTTNLTLNVSDSSSYYSVRVSGVSSSVIKVKLFVNGGTIGNLTVGKIGISATDAQIVVNGGTIKGIDIGINMTDSTLVVGKENTTNKEINITSTNTSSNAVGAIYSENSSVTINSGNISGGFSGIYAAQNSSAPGIVSSLLVNGGTVTGVNGIYLAQEDAEIKGGVVKTTSIMGYALFLDHSVATVYKGIFVGDIMVTGGSILTLGVIDTTNNIYSSSADIAVYGSATLVQGSQTREAITVEEGSTFAFNRGFIGTPSLTYDDGYTCSSNSSCVVNTSNLITGYTTTYNSKQIYGIAVAVASIGSDKYITLEDAFDELGITSKTITLLGHVDEKINLDDYDRVTKRGILDLNGYIWYCEGDAIISYWPEMELDLTITDTSASNTGALTSIYIAEARGGSYKIHLLKGTVGSITILEAVELIVGDSTSTSRNLRVFWLEQNYAYGSFVYNGGFIGEYRFLPGLTQTINGQATATTITYKGTNYSGTKLNVAKISSGSSTYYYETLQTAFNSSNVCNSTATIQLLGNRQETVAVTCKLTNVTIDLNTKTWKNEGQYNLNMSNTNTSGSKVTIKSTGGVGYIINEYASTGVVISAGNATMYLESNVTIQAKGTTGGIILSECLQTGSLNVYVRGANLEAYETSSGKVATDVLLYMYGGSIKASGSAISTSRHTTVYYGTITGNVSSSTLNMYGGVIESNTAVSVRYLNMYGGSIYGGATINDNLAFNSGFIGTTSSAQTNNLYTSYTLASGATKVINGKEINATETYSSTTYYGVTVGVAHINGRGQNGTPKYYASLQEAFDDLGTVNSTLVLDGDIENVSVYIEDNAVVGTFDLNGHTWHGDSSLYIDNGNTSLTITDNSGSIGSIRNTTDNSAVMVRFGTLFLEKGFYSTAMVEEAAVSVYEGGTLIVGGDNSTTTNLKMFAEEGGSYGIYAYTFGSTGDNLTITINGGLVENGIKVGNPDTDYIFAVNSADVIVNINGGVVKGGLEIYAATLNAKKGVIVGETYGVKYYDAVLNIGEEYTTLNDIKILSNNGINGGKYVLIPYDDQPYGSSTLNYNGGFIGDGSNGVGAYNSSHSYLTKNINGVEMDTSVTYDSKTYSGITLAAAHIDSTMYLTLAAAFNAVGTTGKTIVIDRNIKEMITASGKKAVIDLNGKTWTYSYYNPYGGSSISAVFDISNNSEITITDNSGSIGKMTYGATEPLIRVNESTLNIYKGDLFGSYVTISATSSTINIGQHKTDSTCVNGVSCSESMTPMTSLEDITISGYRVIDANMSVTSVYGGKIIRTKGDAGVAIAASAGSLIIGDEASSVDNLQILGNDSDGYHAVTISSSTSYTFRGGFIGTKNSSKQTNGDNYGFDTASNNVAGIYNMSLTQGTNTYYGLTIAVARINNTYYNTLRKALANASSGAEVVLVANVNETINICGSINVTINLNGKTWSSSSTTLNVLDSTSNVQMSIKDTASTKGVIKSTLGNAIYLGGSSSNTSSFTLSNVNIEGNTIGLYVRYVTVEVSGGNITGGTDAGIKVLKAQVTVNATVRGNTGMSIHDNSTVDVTGGTITGLASSGIELINGGCSLYIKGGYIVSTNTYAISSDDYYSGTIYVQAGSVQGTGGILVKNNNAKLNLTGGEVKGTNGYAAYMTYGKLNYTGSTLYAIGVPYTYYAGSNIQHLSELEEWTVYETSTVLKTVIVHDVASIGNTTYQTLRGAIQAANSGDTIVLNQSITPSYLDPNYGYKMYGVNNTKEITINLNGKTINNYHRVCFATTYDSTTYSFIKVTGGSLKIIGNGNIVTYGNKVDNIIYNYGGTVTIGDASATYSSNSPKIEGKATYAIYNDNGAVFMFANGSLSVNGGNSNVYYVSASSKLNIRNNYYITIAHSSNVHTATLTQGTIIDDGNGEAPQPGVGSITIEYSTDSNGTLKIIAKSSANIQNVTEKVIMNVAERQNDSTFSYKELSCTLTNQQCSIDITSDKLAYLYNVTYKNELVIRYIREQNSEVIMESSVYNDMMITPKETKSTQLVSNNSLQVFSDKDILLIYINDGSTNLNNYKDTILKAIYGDHYSNILQSITANLSNLNACSVDDGTTVCISKPNIISSATYQSDAPVPISGLNTGKVIIYNYAPKLNPASTVQNQSVTTCEYGSECNVSQLSFVDFTGNDVDNVETVITLNGEVVEMVDSTKVGKYIVTTYAMDSLGNRSMDIVRTYNVVDNVAPTIEVSDDVIYVEKGHRIKNFNVKAFDNSNDVKVEVITSKVNFNKKGSYNVTYKATDSSGNTTILQGVIVVENNVEVILTIVNIVLLIVVALMGYVIYTKRKGLLRN